MTQKPPLPPATPLTPHPALLKVLSVVLALWIGGLLWMYFATVYPHRQPVPVVTTETPVDK